MKTLHLKKLIRSFNLFEVIWLVSVVVLLVFFILLFPDLMFEDKHNTLVVVCSVISIISSPICEMLISKQSRYWTLFSLFCVEIPDIIMLLSLGLYSSAVISLFFWIPFDLLTFFGWKKNPDEVKTELTKVKTFPWWGNLLIVLGMIALALGVGYILSLFPAESSPYVIAFSNVFEIANGIFLLTRHNEQWLAWFGYLICEIIIWVSLGHYIMLITVVAMLINTVYGFIKWLLYIRNSREAKPAIT